MKIFRYLDHRNEIRFGAALPDGGWRETQGDLNAGLVVTSRAAQVKQLLAPVQPTQILGIGLNYRQHAAETGAKIPEYPVVFSKGIGALQHPEAPISLPMRMKSDEVDYECELAVVIGRTCRNAARANALDYVLGYTCANDVSARDWQLKRGGSQWSRGKMFDTFCPLGPYLVTPDEIPNPSGLRIQTVVNGEVLQDGNTNDMIFDVPALIEFLSGSTTLPVGTVILTGTPHGVGMSRQPPRWLQPGDSVAIEIEKIGRLTNPVIDEP